MRQHTTRTILYASVGIGTFTIGGLLIGLPIGHPFLIIMGLALGLIVAAFRKPTHNRPYQLKQGLCNLCWIGEHITGMPCPNYGCQCARCSPFIGRYAPEDSPSYMRDFDE